MDEKLRLLKKYWGHDTFRPLQEEIIDSVMQGHDTLALLPTGGGKSLCYQLPSLMREGVCLVVSPLIALMKDQVQQLNDRRLKAACIVSGMGRAEVSGVLGNALCGALKFLYVSPERLQQRMFVEHFRRMKVSMIAVDEAHCVSQWGYDFRPPYLEIAAIRAYHPLAPMLALTATATPTVADDICTQLQMHGCRRFRSSFVRPNLAYRVVNCGDKNPRLLQLAGASEGSGIVYTRSRRNTQSVARLLAGHGIAATYYHAGLDACERDRRQAQWMAGEVRVMVATNAFGMGIDKPDVRFVVHLDMPDSLEAYFQEAGRAGRDGLPASATLLYDPSDGILRRKDIDLDFPPIKQIRNVYRALCNHYKIPMGSGADLQRDFNMEDVCAAYGFSPRLFYSACRFLEREGLVAIPDRESATSLLHIPTSRDELYRFQLNHLRLGNLLQLVMRMYPGVMNVPVAIDERKIGTQCYADETEVKAMLKRLHEMHIVDYRPRTDKPQIVFSSPRIDESLVCPREHGYDQLKSAASRRLDAVLSYVEDAGRCRSRQLVAYFGEHVDVDCGLCDVCRRQEQDGDSVGDAVVACLQAGALPLRSLCDLLEARGYRSPSHSLRQMLDRGEVLMDGNMVLRLS